MTFSGFLSSNPEVNPDFYNWNVVFIKYCDGASFAGNVWVVMFELDVLRRYACVTHYTCMYLRKGGETLHCEMVNK